MLVKGATDWNSNYIYHKACDQITSHSQTSTAQPLKFGTGYIISSHILLNMCLFIHTGIKVGLGSNTFYQIQIQIQIHFFQSFKYKYKYKYTDKNLIKHKYRYKYSPSNTNTNTHWGWDKIDAILQMTYSNSFCCKNIVLFIQISMKTVSKGPIYNKPGCLLWFRQWLGTE